MTHAWTPAPDERQPDTAAVPDAESDTAAEEAAEPEASDSADSADSADAAWSTGDARVDDAVARLGVLDERDLDEHADVYDAIHSDLADVLDDAARPSSQQ
jgi:hypothetical protein